MLPAEERAKIEAQVALSKRLALGVVLSLIPAAGVGSIAAIYIGWQAKRKIKATQDTLVGHGMANWCIIAGIIGLFANLYLLGDILRQ